MSLFQFCIPVFHSLLLGLLLTACGVKPISKHKPEEKPPEPRNVATGAVSMTARDEKQRRSWTIQAEASKIAFRGEGALSGTLDKVHGEIFEKDEVASTFTALTGTADQKTRDLQLEGDVVVTAVDLDRAARESSQPRAPTRKKVPAKLTATKVRWLEDKGLIEASGSVVVENPDYKVGPYAKLWATPDLSDVGTPDMFKGWKKRDK